MRHTTLSSFIDTIKSRWEQGTGHTPFLGSGISAQSGIIMSQEFSDYLAYTVYRVVKQSEGRGHWDLRKWGWPPQPTSKETQATYDYFFEAFAKQKKRYQFETIPANPSRDHKIEKVLARMDRSPSEHGSERDIHMRRPLVPGILRHDALYQSEDELDQTRRHRKVANEPSDPNLSPSSHTYIEDMALRSLSHWTETLEFLTRVSVGELSGKIFLTEPDTSVIDDFNRHITRGKRPNLIHNMIARLSRSLRSHVVLTTNFDELIEESYRAQGEPLYVVPVSIHGGLPSYSTVRAQDCLIKMHGDILETRADSSINEPPTALDKERFFQYLRGPMSPQMDQPADFIKSDLLVMGYSGSDARCVQMIKYVLDMDPDFRVYWVCHSSRDIRRIEVLFGDYISPDDSRACSRFHLVESDRADLLLWELYQKLNLALPGGGYSIQFSHHEPPARFSRPTQEDTHVLEKIYDKVKSLPVAEPICVEMETSTARPMAEVFHLFVSARYDALWLEMEDYRDPLDLFFHILSSMSIRRGFFQLEWVNFTPPLETKNKKTLSDEDIKALSLRLKLLIDKFGIATNKWVLFLYGRNGAGGCTGWKTRYWDEQDMVLFTQVVKIFTDVGIKVILLRNGELRDKRNEEKEEIVRLLTREIRGRLKVDPVKTASKKAPSKKATPAEETVTEADPYQAWFEQYYELTQGSDATTASPPKTDLPGGMPGKPGEEKYKPFPKLEAALFRELHVPTQWSYESILRAVADQFIIKSSTEVSIVATRMLWLYGMTLFRQSRHPAAMISEAVFPCPEKFNKEGRDNDDLRYRLVFGARDSEDFIFPEGGSATVDKDAEFNFEAKRRKFLDYTPDQQGWLKWLAQRNVFLRKPGGYAWMYRDMRLGLQYLLEQTGSFRLLKRPGAYLNPTSGESNHLETSQCEGLWRLRPRLHYMIGDWYLRAFYATGHYTPLIEALYHNVQCMRIASVYVPLNSGNCPPEKLVSARVQLFWAALCQFRRLLRVGRKSLFFWCPGVDFIHAFIGKDGADGTPLSCLEEPLAELERQFKDESSQPRDSESGLLKLCQSYLALAQHEVWQLTEAVNAEGQAHAKQSSPTTTSFSTADHTSVRSQPTYAQDPIEHSTRIIAGDDQVWAENVAKLLGDSGLKFGGDEELRKMFAEPELFLSGDFRTWRFNWLDKWDARNAPERELYRLLWALTKTMYHMIRRAKLLCLVEESRRKPDSDDDLLHEKSRKLWQAICAVGYVAMRLAQHLTPEHFYSDCDQRVRVLTLYGMALGYLNRFHEANRRFNEAHALVVSGMGLTEGKELARIHIRRAEMLVRRADYKWKEELKVRREKPLEDRSVPIKVISYIDECWSALERAEMSLGGISHSSFWWYRLLILRLRCYAAVAEFGDRHIHCLPFRRRLYLPSVVATLLRDTLIIGTGDPFRELRAIDYALSAHRLAEDLNESVFGPPNCPHSQIPQSSELGAHIMSIVECSYPAIPLLEEYRKSVQEKYNAMVKTWSKK